MRRRLIDEQELAHLRANGRTVRQIADELGLPRATVGDRVRALEGARECEGARARAGEPARRIRPATLFAGPEPVVVGIIGDTHLPFAVDGYLDFCADTFAKWSVDCVVHIGDFIENHAISYHESDPDGRSAGDERWMAIDAAQAWYSAFPSVTWILGNHDRLPWRRAYSAGLPSSALRENMYGAPPGWRAVESADIDGVLYTHGTGSGGEHGHKNLARRRGVSAVIGHFHRVGGVHYLPTHDGHQRFGLAVGCGVAHDSYAQAWSKDFGRHALGCGVVRFGQEAHYVPMLRGAR